MKLYRLGTNIPQSDANRLLGLRKNPTLTWKGFQAYAQSINIKQNAHINVKENYNGKKSCV